MVSQAVDKRIELLREPLAPAPADDNPVVDDLVITSGNSLQVSQTALKVKTLLCPYAPNTIIVDLLEDIERNGGLRLGCAATKSILSNATYVLWATPSSRGNDPNANIIVGMAGQQAWNIRILAFSSWMLIGSKRTPPETVMFSEMLLRMTYPARPGYADTLLWSQETELEIENGKVCVPRVVLDNLLNDRLNARTRAIRKGVSPATSPVALVKENGSFVPEEATFAQDYYSSGGNIKVKVEFSSAFAFSTSDGRPSYICVGHMSATQLPGFHSVDTISQYLDKQRLAQSTVIDWETSGSLSVRVRLADVEEFFSDEKTYFFVGLTEDVGLSLCEWTVDNGARHFALASRNPRVDAAIMQHLQKKGGNLRVFSLGITDKARLREVHAESSRPETQTRLMASVMDIGMLLGIALMTNAHGAVEEHMRTMAEIPSQAQRNHSVQGQLKGTGHSIEALSILEGAFAAKLGAVLRASSEKIDKTVPLVTLGINSLVAVEIRSRFLKELAVDVPILKILGGASFVNVCGDILGNSSLRLSMRRKKVGAQGRGKPAVEKRSRSPTPPSLAGLPQTDPATSSVPTSSNTPQLTPRTSRGPVQCPIALRTNQKDSGNHPRRTKERAVCPTHKHIYTSYIEDLDDKSAYNARYTGELHGRLDISKLKKAPHAVGMRHKSLRTSYFMDKSADQAIQR
ncbi:hypothetical protein DL765_003452 [Monosporascus sp. GIB2]|nr:hypothetical protein DL765_003452 [Monosporascus sp. GIB2]